jgi:hypothetical protein
MFRDSFHGSMMQREGVLKYRLRHSRLRGNDGKEADASRCPVDARLYHMQNYISYLQHGKMQVSIFRPTAPDKREGKPLKMERGNIRPVWR